MNMAPLAIGFFALNFGDLFGMLAWEAMPYLLLS
jgi:hypothetical protein